MSVPPPNRGQTARGNPNPPAIGAPTEPVIQWGEPMTITIPPVMADFIRRLRTAQPPQMMLQNGQMPYRRFVPGHGPHHGHGRGTWGRGFGRHGPGPCGHGRRSKGRGKDRKSQKRTAEEEDAEDEVAAEITDLKINEEKKEVKFEDPKKNEATNGTKDPTVPESVEEIIEVPDDVLETLPAFIRQRIERARDNNQEIPSWVSALLGRMADPGPSEDEVQEVKAVDRNSPQESHAVAVEVPTNDAVEPKPSTEAQEDEKFAADGDNTLPWLKLGEMNSKWEQRKADKAHKREQRMKNLTMKNKGKGKGGECKRNTNRFKRWSGFGKNFEKRFVGNTGLGEIELIVKHTEKLVPKDKEQKKSEWKAKKEQWKAKKEEWKAKKDEWKAARRSKKFAKANKDANQEVEIEVKGEVLEEPKAEETAQVAQPAENPNQIVVSPEELGMTQAELVQLFEAIKADNETRKNKK